MRRLQKNPAPWLAWPDADELAEAYKSGAGAWSLYHDFPHSYPQIKAYLQYLGIWRGKSEAQQLRRNREKAENRGDEQPTRSRPSVDPWVKAEMRAITPPPSPALRDFSPMLQVDIKTGKVLVDRRIEVLPRKQRGGMYGRW